MNALGLGLSDLDEEKSQIAHGETVRETANMISFMAEVIGIRDDMYLGEGNTYMREVASAVQEGFDRGVLHQRPTLVNLQCDIDHPTQAMADLVALKKHFGCSTRLRGKKIAMSWAYSPSYGKPLSVPQGIIGLMSRFGMDVTLAHPEGYGLIPEVVDLARKNSAKAAGHSRWCPVWRTPSGAPIWFTPSHGRHSALCSAGLTLLKKGDRDGLKALEKECLANNAKFKSWECNEAKMNLTRVARPSTCTACPRISPTSLRGGSGGKLFEHYRIPTYSEASYKPFVIAAMILMARVKNYPTVLRQLAKA